MVLDKNFGGQSMVRSSHPFPMTSQALIALIACLAIAIAATSFFVFEPAIALVSCLLGWTMLAIAVVDARKFIVSDVLSLPSIPAGLLVARLLHDGQGHHIVVLEHLSAAVLGAAIFYTIRQLYFVWRKREGLGLGDVKLAASAGAWTGLPGLGHVLLLACVLAVSFVLLSHLQNVRSIRRSTAVAFGVFLAPLIWFVWCANTLGLDSGFTRLLTRA
jgi:leader peptidase (prepilin peptidase)/N-methyltransferase